MRETALIVTADDFGMSVPVNEAVEEAHRKGVLTCASLVVAGAAAGDAVRRARKMPGLGVGLHLALIDAPSVLPRDQIPDLMNRQGEGLAATPALTGARIAFDGAVRGQARAEMRAQLSAYRATGLPLDHVDGHWHFHQHPGLLGLLIGMAAEFGVHAVRVPNEPVLASWRAAGRRGLLPRAGAALGQSWLWRRMRRRLGRAGIGCNDWFFGLRDSGAMTRDVLLGVLGHLPRGVSEIGTHPASRPPSGAHALPAHYKVTEELAALIDPDIIEACRGLRRGRFSDLVAPAGAAG